LLAYGYAGFVTVHISRMNLVATACGVVVWTITEIGFCVEAEHFNSSGDEESVPINHPVAPCGVELGVAKAVGSLVVHAAIAASAT